LFDDKNETVSPNVGDIIYCSSFIFTVKRSVNNLTGVRGVTNNINIISDSREEIEKIDIEDVLGRNWSINANDIEVNVSGNKVTLSGKVSSWYQRDGAEKIAWNAPGVEVVDNELLVECDYSSID